MCLYFEPLDSLSMYSGNEYSIREACNLIDEKLEDNPYKVNFTGGEPLVQSEGVLEMAKHVKSKNIPTYLESSCYDSEKFSKVLPFIDYIKIEFKTPDAKFVDSKHYSKLIGNALECLKASVASKKITYIKIVVSSKTELENFKELLDRIFNTVFSRLRCCNCKGHSVLFVVQKFYSSIFVATTDNRPPKLVGLWNFKIS